MCSFGSLFDKEITQAKERRSFMRLAAMLKFPMTGVQLPHLDLKGGFHCSNIFFYLYGASYGTFTKEASRISVANWRVLRAEAQYRSGAECDMRTSTMLYRRISCGLSIGARQV